ncbi:TlpA family protein disulfide reductase [Agromyces sp. NPDC058136]|uniref:TlpA family protein disulfide reductase n=1 Tax=Agromyces sp. NPDC058136 TaxID=3346354 RepID=UPI0036DB00C7
MDLLPALATAAALVGVATAAGLVWRARQGRAVRGAGAGRGRRDASTPVLAAELGLAGDAFGADATLVQFSTEFCSRCPATARLLGAIAAETPGIRHVEVDLTRRADLASRFDVTQTPTTLVVDGDGVVHARIGGAPRAETVRAELDQIIRRNHVSVS